MNNFNFNLFKYFYYVVYYKGFTNASKELNIAQSALSYNVKTLESQLDKQLIIRDNKNFKLTDDGYNLYEVLKSVFSSLEKSVNQFIDNSVTYSELTIAVRHSLSDYIFKESINEILKRIPNLHINIKLYSKLDEKKYNEEYDILIDYNDYTNMLQNTNIKELCKIDNIFVCGKELYDEYSNVLSIKDLSSAKLISLNPNRKNGKFQHICFNNGILFTNTISINDSVLCKKLIKDNIGICFVNEDFVKEELATGEIKKISIEEELFSDVVCIAYKNNSKKELVQKVLNIIERQYED